MIKTCSPWVAIVLGSLVTGCALDEPAPASVESTEEEVQISGCPTTPPVTFGPPTTAYGRPTFKWQAVPNADSYTLVVLDDDNPGWRHHAPGLTDTSYSPPVDLPMKRLRWKVKGEGSCAGPYSESTYFTVAPVVPCPPTQAPVILQPPSTTPDTRPVFEWTHVPGAESYSIFVRRMPDENWPPGYSPVILTATSYRWEASLAPGNYRFSITPNSRCGNGARAHKDFTIGPTVPGTCPRAGRPIMVAPDGPTTSRPTFRWVCVRGCTAYTIVVQNWPEQRFVHNVPNIPPVRDEDGFCTYPSPIDFAPVEHGVKVKCDDVCGPTPYSPYMMFTPQ